MRWLAGRIPPVTATQLGIFRVFFACAVAATLFDLRLPTEPFPRELHLTTHQLAQFEWVRSLAARPDLVERMEIAGLVLAGLFALGIATRASFTALVFVLTVWTLVRLTRTGAHVWSALLVGVWAMLPVRWGDGFSVDAWLRRRLARPAAPSDARTEYGYALWIPGVVFGTAMFAAGVAKLYSSGIGWITNGTVKYIFVIDAARAPTDWGLWVAQHNWAAVLLSAGGIFTELALVFAVFVRRPLARVPFAVLGFGLLFGFWAFQHELWLAWWTLYLAFFIPWTSIFRARTPEHASPDPIPAGSRLLRPAQWAALAAVIGLQAAAIVLRIEIAPVLSDYPMYSTTYGSIEEFEKRNPIPATYRFTARFADRTQRDVTAIAETLQVDDVIRDAHNRIVDDPAHRETHLETLQAATARLSNHFGEPVTGLVIRIDQRAFDFNEGAFRWKYINHPIGDYTIPAVSD